ncbi:MAG: hypothetical protein JJU29_16135 [Verrucomicrobia bacterium]|nr:hypothetical protein [Verrucomicrobiota bacterium]MCH8513581.1 hypothetical protein [Kiritimatiellia bacterium]
MKAIPTLWVHFRFFRNRSPADLRFWGPVWILQLLNTFQYRLDRLLWGITLLTLIPVLGIVFWSGNRYSERNNPFLRTRPLPRGTCFWVDAGIPCVLYLLIPLCREIPMVVHNGFGFANLLWAWLDMLVLHGLFFSCVWMLGAFLPRIQNPARFGGGLLAVLSIHFLIWNVSSMALSHLGEPDRYSTMFSINTHGYFTLFATSVSLLILCVVGMALRLRGNGILWYVMLLMVPAFTLCLRWGPFATQQWVSAMDRNRNLSHAREGGYHLEATSYFDWFEKSIESNAGPVVRYHFNVHAEPKPTNKVLAMDLMQTRIQGPASSKTLAQNFPTSFFGSNISSLLIRPYYQERGWQNPIRPQMVHNLLWNQSVRFVGEETWEFHGQPVTLEHKIRLTEYKLHPLMENAGLDAEFKQRKGWRNLKIGGFSRERNLRGHNTEHPNYHVILTADLQIRQENLIWKRLLTGPPPMRNLALVFHDQGEGKPEGSVIHQSPWRYLKGGAFPSFVFSRHRKWSFTESYPANPTDVNADVGERSRSRLRVDLFEILPVGSYQGEVSAYMRFPQIREDLHTWAYREALGNLTRHNPLNALEKIRQGERLSDWPSHSFNELVLQLGDYPGDAYRDLLFEAAKTEPRLAGLIIHNGWEEEAMDTWLDLAAQKRNLPDEVLKCFLRLNDPRLNEALLHRQRYAPHPLLLSATQLDPDRFRALKRETRIGMDLFQEIFMRWRNSERWLSAGFEPVVSSAIWLGRLEAMPYLEWPDPSITFRDSAPPYGPMPECH